MRYSLVALDFDGTLVDSARCIALSLERALNGCGCACNASAIPELIGLPLHTIISTSSPGVDTATIERVIAAYRTNYAALEDELITLFPGVPETLERLRAANVDLAVATNKFTYRAELTLSRLRLAPLFKVIVGAEQVEHPKPHPAILQRVLVRTGHAAGNALMVGDTVWDLEMAERAGLASCAVTWGNHSIERLATARPTHVIGAFPALLEVVQTVVH